MRVVTNATNNTWVGGDYTGANRPFARVTIQRLSMQNRTIPNGPAIAFSSTKQVYSSTLFGQVGVPMELPNIKSVERSHSVDQDAATCVITMYNTRPLPLGTAPDATGDYDQLGFYTYNRGATPVFSLSANAWQNVIVPDRIIRTFEGFGFNASVAAEKDTHLYPTGVWSIDDVQYTHDGLIKIQCRDLAKNLIEQISFPPVVPFEQYPLEFTKYGTITGYNYDIVPTGATWTTPTFDTSSTAPYVGVNGSVYGHKGTDAFDTSDSTYWLSWGRAHPDSQAAYEWIQAKFSSRNLQAVKTKVWGGPYTVFLSVYANGAWQGTRIIPYVNFAPIFKDNGANIKYVKSYTVSQGGTLTIALPTAYTNVTKIRLTFHHLYNSQLGTYPYRAGVRSLQIAPQTTKVISSPIIGGNYNDFSDAMKLLLSYGGFWWPSATVTDGGAARNYYSDGTYVDSYAPSDDPFLVVGRVWGDIETTGAYSPAQLGPPVFDHKPLMDNLNFLKDIVGWLFFVDESGGAIMRQPNIWSIGNYIQGGQMSAGYAQGASNVITIDEKQTLIGLTTTISSRNMRERIFVSNITGGAAGMAVGYNPYPAGLRRIAGWCVDTDTEIFTKRGWLKYDEVKSGDMTLSLNEETHLSEWQYIKDVNVFDSAPRDMIEFKANNFSALTTANHRWPVERYSTKNKKWENKTVQSDQLTSMDRIVRSSKRGDITIEPVFLDSLVELVAWTYTESSIKSKGNYRGIVIYQNESVNPSNCIRIRESLESLVPGKWKETRRKGCNEFRLSASATRLIIEHLDECKAPKIEFLEMLTQKQLELFIDVSVKADGHERYTSEFSKKTTRQFYQNVGPRLDAFLNACALAGVATSYHVREGSGLNYYGNKDLATVTLLQSNYYPPAQRKGVQLERRTEESIVWCPSMPKHHNWLARRNGSTYYTSNTDQHFSTDTEAQIMADLIGLRALFTFRTNSLTIVGNPAIQVDDQVRIKEHVTGESFYHYIHGIHSVNDLSTGQWTYDLETHWLGSAPFSDWVFNPGNLADETLQYLRATQLSNVTGASF